MLYNPCAKKGLDMPKEITDNLPMPLDVLEVYGIPWFLVQQMCQNKQK